MQRLALVVALSASLSGCAVYHPEPLSTLPGLAKSERAFVTHPLGIAVAASLALESSPDLLIARRKAGVSEAQAYASGLLPDPQFSASGDHPTVHGVGLVNGYALGLSQDLQALLTEPSRAEGADAKRKQAQLDLLWAEWQTIQKTANLFAQKYYLDEKSVLLGRASDLLEKQYARSDRALAAHNTTIDVTGADLSAALDVKSQYNAAARAALATDSDLRLELNLGPQVVLELADPGDPGAITEQEIRAALSNVAHNRPDLLALQAGYHAQEEAVRTAILEQFPAINLGFSRASDTSNIQTNGLSLTFNIPIFGNTQAKIHIERATRAELRAEYQARLNQTQADAWRIWRSLNLVRSQIRQLEASLPVVQHMAAVGQKAYSSGNLPPATYVLLQTSITTRRSELLDLKVTLWSDTIALRTLLAMTPFFAGLPQ